MKGQRLLFPIESDEAMHPCPGGPACHAHDPLTSYEAAERLRDSGRLGAQQRTVLKSLSECDGSTHAELGAFMGVHWLTPARRLPELERAGYVKKGESRRCAVKGSRCTTWWLVEEGDLGEARDVRQ